MLLDTILHPSLAANELLASAAVGAVAFPSVLAFSQTAIFKPLKITVASRLSPVCGAISVTLAGFVASVSAIEACSLLQNSLRDANGEREDSKISFSTPELVISTVSSVVVFHALGGRFSSVLPSHLFHPGAFARERIPAIRGFQLANASEKNLIRDYGKRYGCHTCGKKQVSSFVSDHQPPSHLLRNSNSSASGGASPSEVGGKVKQLGSEVSSGNGVAENAVVRQFFYPQCYRCSSLQGGYLNGGGTAKAIITHPSSLRLYHIFLPIPFTVAYLKSRLQEEISLPLLKKMSTQRSGVVKHISQTSAAGRDVVEKASQTPATGSTVSVASPSAKASLRSIIQESDISQLVSNFPLLIVWQRAVQFLDSFKNPGDRFHIMLWAFVIVAAWGTV